MAPFADLVIVIPGILGSRLVRRARSGRTEVAWDFSVRSLPKTIRSIASEELVLDPWATPGEDGVEADALFSYQLLPGFFGVDDYSALVEALRSAVREHGLEKAHPELQVLTHPYDWRWSNSYAAEGLARRVREALPAWRERSGARAAKVWLVAHSMGGLVARYYCEHLGGATDVRGVVTMGTPHRGSVNALDAIGNGKHLGPFDVSSLVRSLPSAYELLPLFPVLKIDDPDHRRLARLADELGLDGTTGEPVSTPSVPAPLRALDPRRLRHALEFHAGIRGPAEQRASTGAPCPYLQRVVFNRRQPTAQAVKLSHDRLEVLPQYPLLRPDASAWDVPSDDRGDGTVPQRAAVPIEWEDTGDAVANAQKHTGIQATAEAIDSVLNWLMPSDVSGYRGSEVADDDVVALGLPDVLTVGEELEVRLSSERSTFASVDLVNLASGAIVTKPVSVGREPSAVGFAGLPEATYRVVVRPRSSSSPVVSDYVLVLEP